MKYYRENNFREPEFEADPYSFKVTLFKSNPVTIE